jgi:antitoxin component YwqK of YwqJK toxin-antitoxin module
MNKFSIAFIFMLLMANVFGQVKNEADGLYYDDNGNLYNGIFLEYSPDSLTKAEIQVKDGKLDGQTKVYFKNGQLCEIRSFQDGLMHGKWEKWNLDNIKTSEANFNENKKDGKWFVWDDSGILRYDMTYVAGEKKGTWLMYDEKGNLVSSKEY